MLSHALHASFADAAEQRVSDRRVLRLSAQAATPTHEAGIEVHNLSRTGMLVECDGVLEAGTMFEVELPGGARLRAEVVWSDERLFGCRFEQTLTQAQLSAALLRSARPAQEVAPLPTPLSRDEAMARLREHWDMEDDPEPLAVAKLPVGARLWLIGGLGFAGWAVPAAAAWALF
jgi:hypothetical protein